MPSEKDEIAALRESVEETRAIVDGIFPVAVDVGVDDDFASFAWPSGAAGLLARGFALMDTTTALAEQGRLADAQISLRILLEHSVVFCWIAIDPETNLVEWRGWDDHRRLKIHNEGKRFGAEILSAERVEEIGKPPRPRSVADLADLVDRYWSEKSPAFRDGDIRSFRGLYATVYRRSSALVHPTQEGMERHLRMTDGGIVADIEELPPNPSAPVALIAPMMAFMLIVYAHHFHLPDEGIVQALETALSQGD